MSSYEDSSLTEIEAVLDALEEATAAEVYDATRGYSPKALAAVAASRADAAGGGGGGGGDLTLLGPLTVQFDTSGMSPVENGVKLGDLAAGSLVVGAAIFVPDVTWDGGGDNLLALSITPDGQDASSGVDFCSARAVLNDNFGDGDLYVESRTLANQEFRSAYAAEACDVFLHYLGNNPSSVGSAIAYVLVDVAGGGGGGTAPVHCVIARDAPIDVRTVGDHPILWDALYDNLWDFNSLLSIPDGLGLDFSFDGSSGSIETTEAGVWSFTYQTATGDDSTWHAALNTGVGQATLDLGRDSTSMSIIITNVLGLPSGITLDHRVSTTTEATNNPYTMGFLYLLVTRIG